MPIGWAGCAGPVRWWRLLSGQEEEAGERRLRGTLHRRAGLRRGPVWLHSWVRRENDLLGGTYFSVEK